MNRYPGTCRDCGALERVREALERIDGNLRRVRHSPT